MQKNHLPELEIQTEKCTVEYAGHHLVPGILSGFLCSSQQLSAGISKDQIWSIVIKVDKLVSEQQ